MNPHDNDYRPLTPHNEPVCSASVAGVDEPGRMRRTGCANPIDDETVLSRALDHVRERLIDGLRHGFFQFTITCELVKDRKRRLVVTTGKSQQFTIPADELE
jgi:hypothetical protein